MLHLARNGTVPIKGPGFLKAFRLQCRRNFGINNWLKVRGRQNSLETRQGVQIPSLSVEQASEIVTKGLEDYGTDLNQEGLFFGTGQYFRLIGRERVIVSHSENGFGSSKEQHSAVGCHTVILDCNLASEDVDRLMDSLEGVARYKIRSGEVNSVDRGDWTHGFTVTDCFAIFSKDASSLCTFKDKSTLTLVVDGEIEMIPLTDLKHVNVVLGEEPWNEQAIEIENKDGTVTQLLGYCIENDQRDLAMLMVDTEWTIKAAALLCLKMRKLGHPVNLRLPRVLTPQGNPWVENRHELWTKFSTSV